MNNLEEKLAEVAARCGVDLSVVVEKLKETLADKDFCPTYAKEDLKHPKRVALALKAVELHIRSRQTRATEFEDFVVFGIEKYRSGSVKVYAYFLDRQKKMPIVVTNTKLQENIDKVELFSVYRAELSINSDRNVAFTTEDTVFEKKSVLKRDIKEYVSEVLEIPFVYIQDLLKYIPETNDAGFPVDPMDLVAVYGYMMTRGKIIILDDNKTPPADVIDSIKRIGDNEFVVIDNPIRVFTADIFTKQFSEAEGFVIGRPRFIESTDRGSKNSDTEENSDDDKTTYYDIAINSICVYPEIICRR